MSIENYEKVRTEIINRDLETVCDVSKWLRDLARNDLAWNYDDSPEDIIGKDDVELFSDVEVKALKKQLLIAEVLAGGRDNFLNLVPSKGGTMNDIERIQTIIVTLLEAAYGKAAAVDICVNALHDDLMERIANQSDEAIELIARRLVDVANYDEEVSDD